MKNTILVIMLFLSISSCSEFNAGKIKCTKEKDCPNDYICSYGYCQKDKCTDTLKNSEGVICSDTEKCNMFTGECDEPIQCFVNGEEKQIEKNCGYNNNGSGNFICNDGFYELKGICTNKDDCENGTYGDLTILPCGLNNKGVNINYCVSGKWEFVCNENTCPNNGESETRPCGENNEGTQTFECLNNFWIPIGTCNIESCTDGETRNIPCEGNGQQSQKCNNNHWVNEGQCLYDGDCTIGSISMDYCGFENPLTQQPQICIQGVWECASFIKVIGTQKYDTFNALAFDKNGNTYVTGAVSGKYTNDTFYPGTKCNIAGSWIPCKDVIIIKFGLVGDIMWEKQVTSEYDNYGAAIAVDKDDNVYVTGKENKLWTDQSSQDPDIFLIKYNSNGNEQWKKPIISSSEYEYGKGIAIDSQSNIYIIGEITGNHGINTSNGYLDIILAKYNSAGVLQWSKLYGSEGNDYGKAITITSSGDILIAGDTCNTEDCPSSEYNIILKKINANGNEMNSIVISTDKEDKVTSIATDSDGNIYLTGYTYGSFEGNENAGQKDAFLIKYTNALVPVWYKHIGTSADDEGNGLAIDENKNVYVVGYTKGSLIPNANHGGSDIFIAKFTPAGQFTVIKQWGSGNDDIAKGISIKNNNLHIVGEAGGKLFEQTTSGDADAFLIKWKD